MARKPTNPGMAAINAQLNALTANIPPPGTATTTSKVSNVSNSGQMSTSTQKTGATGGVSNVTNISTQGAPGLNASSPYNMPSTPINASDLINSYRTILGL